MALSEMGVSDHTGGSGSVYPRSTDTGITEIEAWAELLFASTRGSVRSVPEQTLTSITTSLLKLNITIISYTCSCFSSRAENLPAYQRRVFR